MANKRRTLREKMEANLCQVFSNVDSSSLKTKTTYTRLAQSVERQPFKLVVEGSSPLSGVAFVLPSLLTSQNKST